MKSKIQILADDKIPFLKGVLDDHCNMEYLSGGSINNYHLKNADALIIRTRTKCNQDLLEGSSVKIIASATIGHDHIDKDYCLKAGIKWVNAPGCNSGSVMQYMASALVNLSLKHEFSFKEKTLGIVGCGNVGSKVLKLAKSIGMKVLVNDPPLKRLGSKNEFVSLDYLLEHADIISLHVPLNRGGDDNTLHLANQEFFLKVKKGAFLINSSRGEVVDEKALIKVLKDEKLQGAVIDVWENEPNINHELLKLIDYGTPHIAGYSADGKANGTASVVRSISKYFNLPINDWIPKAIPPPEEAFIDISDQDHSLETLIRHLILSTYDIKLDDQNLRKSIGAFEDLRGNYPIRREFSAFEIKLAKQKIDFIKLAEQLGFNIHKNS